MKIAVIGAGITGVTTTYFLTKRGFKVDLIDILRNFWLKVQFFLS